MQINPYVLFSGQCEEAFNYYAKVMGGKPEFFLYEGSPMVGQTPPEWRKKVMHARLDLHGQVLMGSDPPPAYQQTVQGCSVSLSVEEPAAAERIFQGLADGGEVKMPMQKTFWAERFGMCVDRFGIPWMVNCEKAA